jgi:hypothetical protein
MCSLASVIHGVSLRYGVVPRFCPQYHLPRAGVGGVAPLYQIVVAEAETFHQASWKLEDVPPERQ